MLNANGNEGARWERKASEIVAGGFIDGGPVVDAERFKAVQAEAVRTGLPVVTEVWGLGDDQVTVIGVAPCGCIVVEETFDNEGMPYVEERLLCIGILRHQLRGQCMDRQACDAWVALARERVTPQVLGFLEVQALAKAGDKDAIRWMAAYAGTSRGEGVTCETPEFWFFSGESDAGGQGRVGA